VLSAGNRAKPCEFRYVKSVRNSRVHYCNAVYAWAPKTITDKLQRVLNSAARVVSDTLKFDRGLTSLLHDELHWLDVPERVTYKMGVMVYRCLHGQTPRYLADHLITSSDVASRLRLRSQTDTSSSYRAVDSTHTAVGRFRSLVPRSGIRCLTNSEIRRVVLTVLSSFLRQSCLYTNVTSALEVFLNVTRYINPRFTYLLTCESCAIAKMTAQCAL